VPHPQFAAAYGFVQFLVDKESVFPHNAFNSATGDNTVHEKTLNKTLELNLFHEKSPLKTFHFPADAVWSFVWLVFAD
jgi:hypothetical protein